MSLLTHDIFFLSYRESNAEENWQRLIQRFPRAKRLHGVRGVLRAHQMLATLAESEFFFIVDGDNQIHDDFSFQTPFELYTDSLYVWRAQNPVNDLVYGFGGIKLYNKALLAQPTKVGTDVATTIAPKYLPVPIIASTTAFHVSPQESWRGAFRECAKLTMQLFKKPGDIDTRERLAVWLTKGQDRLHGSWCLLGAKQGHEFAKKSISEVKTIDEINDFYWLETEFVKNNQMLSEISTDSSLLSGL